MPQDGELEARPQQVQHVGGSSEPVLAEGWGGARPGERGGASWGRVLIGGAGPRGRGGACWARAVIRTQRTSCSRLVLSYDLDVSRAGPRSGATCWVQTTAELGPGLVWTWFSQH